MPCTHTAELAISAGPAHGEAGIETESSPLDSVAVTVVVVAPAPAAAMKKILSPSPRFFPFPFSSYFEGFPQIRGMKKKLDPSSHFVWRKRRS